MQIEDQNTLNSNLIDHSLFKLNVLKESSVLINLKIISEQHFAVEWVLYDSALKLFKWYKNI